MYSAVVRELWRVVLWVDLKVEMKGNQSVVSKVVTTVVSWVGLMDTSTAGYSAVRWAVCWVGLTEALLAGYWAVRWVGQLEATLVAHSVVCWAALSVVMPVGKRAALTDVMPVGKKAELTDPTSAEWLVELMDTFKR